MARLVVKGALLKCSQGAASGSLTVTRPNVTAQDKDVGTVMDFAPNTNVAPFGMCRSMLNPTVQSATAAAGGALTPQPCVPNTTSPWSPGCPKLEIQGMKALTDSCKLTCAWGGTIEVSYAGQAAVEVP